MTPCTGAERPRRAAAPPAVAGRHRSAKPAWWRRPATHALVATVSLGAVVTGVTLSGAAGDAPAATATSTSAVAALSGSSPVTSSPVTSSPETQPAWPPLPRTVVAATPEAADDEGTGNDTEEPAEVAGGEPDEAPPAGAATGAQAVDGDLDVEADVDLDGDLDGDPDGDSHDDEYGEETTRARDMVVASLRIDPVLLEPQPGDSEETLAARAELAAVAQRLEAVTDRYDEVASVAQRRTERAESAHTALAEARDRAAAAEEQYRADHEALVAMVNAAYVEGSLGAVGMVFSSQDQGDLMAGMAIADQLNADKSGVVEEAQESADRLADAEADAALLDERVGTAAARAERALQRAERARADVEDDVAAARLLLAESVLADDAEAALDSAALAGLQLAEGSVVFPLAPGYSFVNRDNFGGTSSRWASYHTGVDLSTSCGTPVLAATSGTVEVRTDQSWSGRWLVVVRSDTSTVATWYAHMEALSVTDGQEVRAGQVLGAVGSEGNSTGCHLHFEYHPAGGSIYEDATDPVAWLLALGIYPY